jgi:hypothetical protein
MEIYTKIYGTSLIFVHIGPILSLLCVKLERYVSSDMDLGRNTGTWLKNVNVIKI